MELGKASFGLHRHVEPQHGEESVAPIHRSIISCLEMTRIRIGHPHDRHDGGGKGGDKLRT